jgi:hypothetical protein
MQIDDTHELERRAEAHIAETALKFYNANVVRIRRDLQAAGIALTSDQLKTVRLLILASFASGMETGLEELEG